MNWFKKKCTHPHNRLAVRKEATEIVAKDYGTNITYHLFCQKCAADLHITHLKLFKRKVGLA